MRKLTDTEAAYIAGLLDGEGCFGIDAQKVKLKSGRVRLCFTAIISILMTHKPTIEFMSRIFEGNICTYIRKNENWSPAFSVYLRRQVEVKSLLTQILPYIKTKTEQARLLLQLLELKRKSGERAQIEEQAEIYRKVRTLNSEISDAEYQKVKTMLYRKLRLI